MTWHRILTQRLIRLLWLLRVVSAELDPTAIRGLRIAMYSTYTDMIDAGYKQEADALLQQEVVGT